MIQIAILGYGTVGSGVAEVCRMNAEQIKTQAGAQIYVRRILDIRSFPGDPLADRITSDPEQIFTDPDIHVVVETIGGLGIARELTSRALASGKSVVTSNKELVAAHGRELLDLAARNRVQYLFEAAVGGGIPIIRPLQKCLSANRIISISGILNGTTNYILTSMARTDADFAAALAEAQSLGYAEQDPRSDVDGLDAARKIAILASVASGQHMDSTMVHREGISNLSVIDHRYARALNAKLKLIARFRRNDAEQTELLVAPTLVPHDNPLAMADDVFNAILVEGNALGEALFYGRGAGKLPTASAVVADIIECALHQGKQPHNMIWHSAKPDQIIPHESCPVRALVRLRTAAREQLTDEVIRRQLGDFQVLEAQAPGEDAILIGQTEPISERQLAKTLADWGDRVIGRIRLWRP